MTDFDPAAMAGGLWKRLRDVIMVAERIDTFAFGAEAADAPVRTALEASDAEAVSVEFVLRALRAVCERENYLIVERASAEEGVTAEELAAALGLPRLSVSERAAELLQAGLVARALDSDRVHATEAGVQVVALVRSTAERLAQSLLRARGKESAQGTDNGLPVL